MIIKLMKNTAEPNRVDKSSYLSGTKTYSSAILKDTCSLDAPVILINTNDNLSAFNYLYLEDLNLKYYFIRSIEVVRTGLWQINADRCDVLHTFRNSIKANQGLISKNAYSYDLYVNDNHEVVRADENVECKNFTTSLTAPALYINTVGG